VLRDSAERHEGEVAVGVFPLAAAASHGDGKRAGRPLHTDGDAPSPWSKRRDRGELEPLGGPIPIEELHNIAEEASHTERRADEAERELMEWKKVKFMQDRVGEDFDGLITSVTKFGFFVELTDLFVEGLVPLNSLTDDYYTYYENTRQIIGQRSRKTYSLGQRIRAIVDRIDPVEKKIQFAVLEEKPVVKPKRKKR
jgi:ribonuclease R